MTANSRSRFELKKVSEAERCVEMFGEHRCSLKQGHFGKHKCFDDCSVCWTDAGKARVLLERAEADEALEAERLVLVKELGLREDDWASVQELRLEVKRRKVGDLMCDSAAKL